MLTEHVMLCFKITRHGHLRQFSQFLEFGVMFPFCSQGFANPESYSFVCDLRM